MDVGTPLRAPKKWYENRDNHRWFLSERCSGCVGCMVRPLVSRPLNDTPDTRVINTRKRCAQCVKDKVHVYCTWVSFLRGSMSADRITAELVETLVRIFGLPMDVVLAWLHDCVSANLSSFDSLEKLFIYGNDNGCLPHTGRSSI